MIIDADCHISPEPQPGVSCTAEQLLQRMDRSGVDKALVWLQPPYVRSNIGKSNKYVYDSVRGHPDRFIGFGWADPNVGVQAAVDEARRCLEAYGFAGVKLNGAQNDFFIDDPELALPVVDAVVEAGGMLAFHIGVDALDKTSPWRLARLAARHPATTFLMVHIGGVAFHDMSRLAVDTTREHANVVAIGSAVRPAGILYAIDKLGVDRVMFGSDTPFEFMHVELAKYRAMLEDAPDAVRAKVLGGNAQRLFLK